MNYSWKAWSLKAQVRELTHKGQENSLCHKLFSSENHIKISCFVAKLWPIMSSRLRGGFPTPGKSLWALPVQSMTSQLHQWNKQESSFSNFIGKINDHLWLNDTGSISYVSKILFLSFGTICMHNYLGINKKAEMKKQF